VSAGKDVMNEKIFSSENSSNNETNCYNDYCIQSTLYVKIAGTVIFVLVWSFIVLDIKWVPLGRPAAALMGALLMVLFAVAPQDQVYAILGDKGNLQTLFLLIGMMMLSFTTTGRGYCSTSLSLFSAGTSLSEVSSG